MKFKAPRVQRLGEGERERVPTTRVDVGGNARKHNLTLKVSTNKKTHVEGVSKKDKKTAASLSSGFSARHAEPEDDIPEPGQARILNEKPNPFAALKARIQSVGKQVIAPDTSATDYVDQLLERKVAEPRKEIITREQLRERLLNARKTLPILRTVRTLDYAEEKERANVSEQQTDRRSSDGIDRAEQRKPDATITGGHDGAIGASAPSGSSEQLSDTQVTIRDWLVAPIASRNDAATTSSEAARGTRGADEDLYSGDQSETRSSTPGTQSVPGIGQTGNKGIHPEMETDISGGFDEGGTTERRSEAQETERSFDGPIEHELTGTAINALEIDSSLYEPAAKKRGRKDVPLQHLSDDKGEDAREPVHMRATGPDRVEEGTGRGDYGGPGGTGDSGGNGSNDQGKRSLPIAPPTEPEWPRGISKYNERQELDVASLFDTSNVVCNNCAAAERCTEYRENSVCAFDDAFSGLSSRDLDNVIPTMEVIADLQKKRAMRGVFNEAKVTGGILDPNVSRQLEIAAMAAERVARLKAGAQTANGRTIAIVQNGGGTGLIERLMRAAQGTPELPPAIDTVGIEISETQQTIEEKKP